MTQPEKGKLLDVPRWWRKSVRNLLDLHRKIGEAEDEVGDARGTWGQAKIRHEIRMAMWKERKKAKGKGER